MPEEGKKKAVAVKPPVQKEIVRDEGAAKALQTLGYTFSHFADGKAHYHSQDGAWASLDSTWKEVTE